MPSGYLEAVISPAFAVEIKAKNAAILIDILKTFPPKRPAPSDIGISVLLRVSGFKTPTVTKITSVYRIEVTIMERIILID